MVMYIYIFALNDILMSSHTSRGQFSSNWRQGKIMKFITLGRIKIDVIGLVTSEETEYIHNLTNFYTRVLKT